MTRFRRWLNEPVNEWRVIYRLCICATACTLMAIGAAYWP